MRVVSAGRLDDFDSVEGAARIERNRSTDMVRIDLHIVRSGRGWRVQNAEARTLAVFRTIDAAVEHGETRARQLRFRGLHVRMTVHHAGKASRTIEFSPIAAQGTSYALTRCHLA
jgi:hypothetical protein